MANGKIDPWFWFPDNRPDINNKNEAKIVTLNQPKKEKFDLGSDYSDIDKEEDDQKIESQNEVEHFNQNSRTDTYRSVVLDRQATLKKSNLRFFTYEQ